MRKPNEMKFSVSLQLAINFLLQFARQEKRVYNYSWPQWEPLTFFNKITFGPISSVTTRPAHWDTFHNDGREWDAMSEAEREIWVERFEREVTFYLPNVRLPVAKVTVRGQRFPDGKEEWWVYGLHYAMKPGEKMDLGHGIVEIAPGIPLSEHFVSPSRRATIHSRNPNHSVDIGD